MHRLMQPLIALSILTLPPVAVGEALAARGVAAEQAVRILNRARVADLRCRFLSQSLREELARYTARAELAAASQASTDTARRAAAAGAAEGRAARCDADTKADVGETLAAAREAVQAADSGRRLATSATPMPLAAKGKAGDLGTYARVVAAYYIERKCRHLSAGQDARYWKAVAALHRATVARNGAGAVAPVMRQAERSAARVSCGADTLIAVKAGLAEAARL